jgi:hypothetical protein
MADHAPCARRTPDAANQSDRDRFSAPGASTSPLPDPARPRAQDPGPLRAAHTPNFPALLRQLGASLLVTTYQAGKLVLLRDEGGVQEVFAVSVLPRRFPDLINDDDNLLESSFVAPTESLGEVADTVRPSRVT